MTWSLTWQKPCMPAGVHEAAVPPPPFIMFIRQQSARVTNKQALYSYQQAEKTCMFVLCQFKFFFLKFNLWTCTNNLKVYRTKVRACSY